jgi:hypothetical protein
VRDELIVLAPFLAVADERSFTKAATGGKWAIFNGDPASAICDAANLCQLLSRLGGRQTRADPAEDVGHDRLFVEVVEKVVHVPLVEFQRLVR